MLKGTAGTLAPPDGSLAGLALVGELPGLGREDEKAVLDGGWVGLAGAVARAPLGEYGEPGASPMDGLMESLRAFLFLGGVLLDMIFEIASNAKWRVENRELSVCLEEPFVGY